MSTKKGDPPLWEYSGWLIAGGQKCFTKYERVCRYQNQPVCQTQVQRKCVTHPIKYCRTISTPQFFVSWFFISFFTIVRRNTVWTQAWTLYGVIGRVEWKSTCCDFLKTGTLLPIRYMYFVQYSFKAPCRKIVNFGRVRAGSAQQRFNFQKITFLKINIVVENWQISSVYFKEQKQKNKRES